jgi:hypothetical protein
MKKFDYNIAADLFKVITTTQGKTDIGSLVEGITLEK